MFVVTNNQGVTFTIGSLLQYGSVLTAHADALHEEYYFVVQSGK